MWFRLLELAIRLAALGILALIAYTCRTLQIAYLASLEKDAALQKYRNRLVFAFGDRALTLDDTAFNRKPKGYSKCLLSELPRITNSLTIICQ